MKLINGNNYKKYLFYIINIFIISIGVLSYSITYHNPSLRLYIVKNILFNNNDIIKQNNNIDLPILNIQIKNKHLNIIKSVRNEYKDKMILDKKEYYPAIIKNRNDVTPINIRIKGDWTSHIKLQKKMSFRIRIKDENTFLGMRKFSIQHPRERKWLKEWLFTKILYNNNILSPRISFIKVIINDEHWGIYLLEESFSKELLEFNKRRESVIVKMSEYFSWAVMKFIYKQDDIPPEGVPQEIEMFDYDKYSKNKHFVNLYTVAKIKYQSALNRSEDFSKLFDVNKMAVYWALCDLFQAHHGCKTTHNMRFYFNPLNSLLEPIHFDGDPGMTSGMVGDWKNNFLNSGKDYDFQRKYIHNLEKFTSYKFINNIKLKYDPIIIDIENILKKEWPEYEKFSWEGLFQSSYKLRTYIDIIPPEYTLRSHINNDNIVLPDDILLQINNQRKLLLEILDIQYKVLNSKNWSSLEMHNNIKLPIILKKSEIINIKRPLSILENKHLNMRIKYKILGKSNINFSKVFRRNNYSHFNIYKNLSTSITIDKLLKSHNYISLDNITNTIKFRTGSYNVHSDIFIPPGYKVNIFPGTKILFDDSSILLSYSPIYLNGTIENPIKFSSIKDNWPGIILINTKEKSKFEHAIISNMKFIDRPGWISFAGITFYKSPVNIINSVFSNSKYEDMIGFINSNFNIHNSIFENAKLDAIDVDYSNGKISTSTFRYVGNDAIDISSSDVFLDNITIISSYDKGVSVGENSILDIKNSSIDNSSIGLVSKDGSHVMMADVNISNSTIVGIASYNKKKEYGDSSIKGSNITFINNNNNYYLEKHNSIIVNEKVFKVNMRNLKNILYE